MTIEMTYNEEPADAELISHEDNETIPESVFCRELRSKKFFLFDALATEAAQYMDGSNHCWCYETQQVVGPDGGKVHPRRCTPQRSCYKSAFAPIT